MKIALMVLINPEIFCQIFGVYYNPNIVRLIFAYIFETSKSNSVPPEERHIPLKEPVSPIPDI